MRRRAELSSEEARWLAIDAQGLGRPRPRGPVGRRHIRSVIEAAGLLQLDAINVLARTQFLVLFSRLGSYDVARLHDITGPGGDLFEYWGRMASLLPMAHQPLFRWRMARHGPYGDGPTRVARRQAWQDANAGYIASVLEEVRERGPLRASQLSDPRRRDGEWWGRRSVGRQALELLFTKGELAAWRTAGFERVYDLPERVIPAAILSQPTPPTDEAHRRLLALAARSLGVATLGDLANYYLVKQQAAKARVAELLDAGELIEVTVEGWRDNAYVVPNARPRPPARQHATLLSPFDSLIWERSRTRRLFGFDYRIEVYTPPADRKYGYFVLPVLLGDRLVARFDLKADRKTATLRVASAFIEPGMDAADVAAAAATELDALRTWLQLRHITVARRGNLASRLLEHVGARSLTPRAGDGA
ncbi:MAG TPA: crosslink repair DNA glycosylase YcaQ family protein [Acidimicrobiia bacterium]|nr:crosslink repair DNA glycosylase YcaQ family protein [Acidimicrobiia bacterium]